MVFAFSIVLQDTATGEVTQRIVESIECRINSCMTKHGKDGINFTMKGNSDGTVQYTIICEYCPNFVSNPLTVNSWEKNIEQHISPTAAPKKGTNHFSNKQSLSGQSRMSSFIIRQSPVTVNDFENPALARQCFGIPIEVDSMEEDLAKNLPYRDTLQFSPVLRPIPISVIAKPGTNARSITVGHTFRHAYCSLISPFGDRPFPNHICLFCRGIANLRQFKREMQKRDGGIEKKRAYTDDHLDNIVHRAQEIATSNTALRRIVLRSAKQKARPEKTLSQTLKVS